MGLLDSLFGSSLERQLEETYAQLHGNEYARGLISTAKAMLASDPSISSPPLAFNQIVGDGVTAEDWSWWWSLQPLERAVMLANDESFITAALVQLRVELGDINEATRQVRRKFPRFGNPRHPGDYRSTDDRPLPRELKGRVSSAALRLAGSLRESHTSMNALVREMIRKRQL